MKKIIWSNVNLNVNEWRDGYAEFCEHNNITPGGENDLMDWAVETNYHYLDDEYYNLDKRIEEKILLIANLGLWTGRAAGYKIIKSKNLKDILNIEDSYFEIYGDGKNIRAFGVHHDGTNYYLYRAIRNGRDIDKLLTAIYNGETITPAKLNYYTRSIYNDVANIYGW